MNSGNSGPDRRSVEDEQSATLENPIDDGLGEVFVVEVNGVAGMILGYLYWRWGIESAVLAHFAADMVVQGIGPRLVV